MRKENKGEKPKITVWSKRPRRETFISIEEIADLVSDLNSVEDSLDVIAIVLRR